MPAHLVDDRLWAPIHGPFYARLAPPSRQPKGANAGKWRVYVLVLPFDPATTIMVPGGELKFITAGAPPDGIIQRTPSQWSGADTSFVFRLRLGEGATAKVLVLDEVQYREPLYENEHVSNLVDSTIHCEDVVAWQVH